MVMVVVVAIMRMTRRMMMMVMQLFKGHTYTQDERVYIRMLIG